MVTLGRRDLVWMGARGTAKAVVRMEATVKALANILRIEANVFRSRR